MSPLFRRIVICAGLAASGLPSLSPAQSTAATVPPRTTTTRRSHSITGTPIVQQSPNGLYQLSVTDSGIVMRGPKGGVKISDSGIEIAGGTNARITLKGSDIDIKGDVSAQVSTEGASVRLDQGGATLTSGRVLLGCPSGRPAARSGDAVDTGTNPPMVAQGSSTVLVC
jgi:uncharacterized Zn-binding protein involved in type VI secretion